MKNYMFLFLSMSFVCADVKNINVKRSGGFYDTKIPTSVTAKMPIVSSKLDRTADGAGSTMFSIENSGYYYLSSDVVADPDTGKTPDSIIKITADDVVLDLCGKSIYHYDTTAFGAGGIVISGARDNVKICNGQIDSVTVGAGGSIVIDPGTDNYVKNVVIENVTIVSQSSTNDGIGLLAKNVENLIVKDVTTQNNQNQGIQITIDGSTKNKNCILENIIVQSSGGVGIDIDNVNQLELKNIATASTANKGISLNTVNDLKMNKVTADDCDGSSGSGIGIELNTVIGCSLEDIRIQRVYDDTTARGLYLNTVKGGSFSNINIIECHGKAGGDNVNGLDLSASENLIFERVLSQGCYTYSGATTGIVKALNIDSTTNNLKFKNCSFNFSHDTGSAYGVYIDSSRVINFDNVEASQNVGVAVGKGFYITGSSNNYFNNCLAVKNGATATAGVAAGFDFILSSTSNQLNGCKARANYCYDTSATGFNIDGSILCYLRDCVASDQTNTNDSDVVAVEVVGIKVNNAHYCRIINCEASGNLETTTTSHANNLAAGIYITGDNDPAAVGNVVIGCVCENNISTDRNSYGIYLRDRGSSPYDGIIRSVVSGNKLNNNRSNAASPAGYGYGYYDNCANTTTLLEKNYSFGHGACTDGGTAFLSNRNMNYYFTVTYKGRDPRLNVVKDVDIMNLNAITLNNWDNLNISVSTDTEY
ncbi:TPA: hypothetical protein DIC20_04810 [Candidatus Dependentiae bacterium]|nr:hypothetical protein [Candidatus Dependentiae bacterium]HCU00995.1 hypothetical protein [Candidatus Dependentiae bacterium]